MTNLLVEESDSVSVVVSDVGEQGPKGDTGTSLHSELTDISTSGHPASTITLEVPPGLVAADVQAAVEELLTKLTQHDHTDTAPIPEAALDIVNTPSDRYVLTYDGNEGRLKWLSSTFYEADLLTVGVGTIVSGSVSSLNTKGDSNTLTIQEVLGVPGYDVQVRFQNVVSFNVIHVYMRYTGGHTCQTQLWNHVGAIWETQSSFNNQNGLIDFEISVADSFKYLDVNGTAYLRFYHPSTGVATHQLLLDSVHLVDSVTGGGGITDHQGLASRSQAESHPGSAISYSNTNTGLVATNVQSAITELQQNKVNATALDGFGKITVSSTPPSNPATNDLWIETL